MKKVYHNLQLSYSDYIQLLFALDMYRIAQQPFIKAAEKYHVDLSTLDCRRSYDAMERLIHIFSEGAVDAPCD